MTQATKRLKLAERTALANASANDFGAGINNLSLRLTSIIKNSQTPAEASGKITIEVKHLLEKRINLLLSGANNREDLINKLVELKSEVQ